MDFEQILAYLQSDGWPVERLGERTARSGFKGHQRAFPFFVHIDTHFATFAAVPYARLPVDETQARQVMDRLLYINAQINLAKFSVDDDGDIVLSVEYPLGSIDVPTVRDALGVLVYYAEKHWPDISPLVAPPR